MHVKSETKSSLNTMGAHVHAGDTSKSIWMCRDVRDFLHSRYMKGRKNLARMTFYFYFSGKSYQSFLDGWGKTPGPHFRRFGIDPVLIRKTNDRWQFRRASWDANWGWAGDTITLVEMLPKL